MRSSSQTASRARCRAFGCSIPRATPTPEPKARTSRSRSPLRSWSRRSAPCSRGMLRLIQRVRPDVIVSVYPVTTEVLGGLRRKGKLDIPVVAGITDLAAMHYWAAPGVDLHLLTHPESEEEVRMVAGHETDV